MGAETAAAEVGGPGGKRARDTPCFWVVMEKKRGFSPSPLLKPSKTPPKVGGYGLLLSGGSRGRAVPKVLRGSW